MGGICKFCHLPSNNAIVLVVNRDLDLLFEDHNLKMLISLKMIASAKMHGNDFERFGHLPTNNTIAKVTSNELDLLCQFNKIGNFNISETVRAGATYEMTLNTRRLSNILVF